MGIMPTALVQLLKISIEIHKAFVYNVGIAVADTSILAEGRRLPSRKEID